MCEEEDKDKNSNDLNPLHPFIQFYYLIFSVSLITDAFTEGKWSLSTVLTRVIVSESNMKNIKNI